MNNDADRCNPVSFPSRRSLLAGAAAFIANWVSGFAPALAAQRDRVRPGKPDWPDEAAWIELGKSTGGRLHRVGVPRLDTPDAKELLSNPFHVGDEVGLTQSSGWLDAWRSEPSVYAVHAESTADVVAAIRFAKAHNLRLAVKGRGHSYFGGSCAPDSLLVWTRKMDAVTVHDRFKPRDSDAVPVPAISVGAGTMWLQAYRAAAAAGHYVQGGGCTTVGVAGLVQGGGFGSFSKGYGTAAASLLEAEIVTADGETRIVNAAREPDLFWALKGGGGGTFGIVTRLTLKLHALPNRFGAANLTLRAKSDDAYRRLLAFFIGFYADKLFNPHWGEQVRARPDNRFDVRMVFQGLTGSEAQAVWKPLLDFVEANSAHYEGLGSFDVASVPAGYLWNAWLYRIFARSVVSFDNRKSAAWGDFWWKGDGEQVGAFWHAYSSAWLPATLLKPEDQAKLTDAWFAASRQWPVAFHFNKGLAGAPSTALDAARDTAMNPDALDAFALAIIASAGPPAFNGLAAADAAAAGARRDRVHAAMRALRTAAPDTGAYVNECDYFQSDWQRAFWGPHYPRLLEVKNRYDPDGLFFVHHGVGSENWTDDGFARRN